MDYTLIAVSVISIIGGLVSIQLIQHNYYKKEDYRYRMAKQKKVDNLEFSQIRKEMGLSKRPPREPPQETNIIDLIKNVDIDQVKGLLGAVQDNDQADDDGVDIMQTITDVAKNNPDLVKSFLGKLNTGEAVDMESNDYVVR